MVTLIIVCGVPGVGKTTVARKIAAHLGKPLYRTDDVRKMLFEDPDYTPAETESVYRSLIEDATTLGGTRIIDGTFSKHYQRRLAYRLADEVVVVNVLAPEERVRKNMAARDEGDLSDADMDVYETVVDGYEPLYRTDHVVFNDGDLGDLGSAAIDVAQQLS